MRIAADKLPLKSILLDEVADQLQYFEEQIILLKEIKKNFNLFQNPIASKPRVGVAAAKYLLREIANSES